MKQYILYTFLHNVKPVSQACAGIIIIIKMNILLKDVVSICDQSTTTTITTPSQSHPIFGENFVRRHLDKSYNWYDKCMCILYCNWMTFGQRQNQSFHLVMRKPTRIQLICTICIYYISRYLHGKLSVVSSFAERPIPTSQLYASHLFRGGQHSRLYSILRWWTDGDVRRCACN